MLMTMKYVDKIKFLKKLLNKGTFPNEKNRIWTMCQATLQMAMMTVIEAEKAGMTGEQMYLHFEDCLNALSVKDHNKDNVDEFKESLNKFMAD